MRCYHCRTYNIARAPMVYNVDNVFIVCCRICYGTYHGYKEINYQPVDHVIKAHRVKIRPEGPKTHYMVCHKCLKLLDLLEDKPKIPESQIYCEGCFV